MLKIYDQNHKQLGMLTKYADLKEEGDLDSADKTLSFVVKDPDEIALKNEYYVRTKKDEFVVKRISHKSRSGLTVTCVLNLEELQGNPFTSFTVSETTLGEAAKKALEGTGWSVGHCDVDKVRSAGMIECNSLQVINNLCIAWMCDHSFDSLHKKVNFYRHMGNKKGAYFMDGLNLKELTKESDSTDYYTVIIPYGKNGLTISDVNDGKNYLENHQYSEKTLSYIWKDESYTDPEALKEDAGLKLEEMSKPRESYSCSVVDLAKQRKDYDILSYELGDEVKLINRETRTLVYQRITRIVNYPQRPDKNTCELSSTVLTFTEMQDRLKRAADIVNYVVSGDGHLNGKVNVSDILNFEAGLAKSETLKAYNEDMQKLRMEVKDIQGDLEDMGNLHETYAELGKANIPSGWVDADMIEDGSVTAEKVNLQDVTNAVFDQVIQGAQFVGAYLQAPTITGARVDAESLTVDGKDVLKIIEDLSGLAADAERIKKLEETVQQIIEVLRNVVSDGT